MNDADLDILFQNGASVILANSREFKALKDEPDAEAQAGLVISTEYRILCKTSDVTDLVEDQEIQVDGEQFFVKTKMKIDDGKLSHVYLGAP